MFNKDVKTKKMTKNIYVTQLNPFKTVLCAIYLGADICVLSSDKILVTASTECKVCVSGSSFTWERVKHARRQFCTKGQIRTKGQFCTRCHFFTNGYFGTRVKKIYTYKLKKKEIKLKN